MAVDLRGDLLSLLPIAFWGIPHRIGRGTRGGGFATTLLVPPVSAGRDHEVDRTLDVAGIIGAKSEDRSITLKVPQEAIDKAENIFAEFKINADKTILLMPGAQWQWRGWPIESFASLGDMLVEDGFDVAITGTKSEKSLIKSIQSAAKSTLIDFSGVFDLKSLAATLTLCKGFVAVESGPASIAGAVGTKGIVLFGPGIPEHFGPVSDQNRVIHKPCSLHPCYQRGDCIKQEDWCMGKISPKEVHETLTEILI